MLGANCHIRLDSVVADRIQMSERNRSEGWQFAKLDGHKNEQELGVILRESSELTNLLHEIVYKKAQKNQPKVLVDGSKHVPSILGNSTVSKIDIDLIWETRQLGLSVKKSNDGQVWLVGVDKFLKSLALVTGKDVPGDVEFVLSLFIGGENLSNFQDAFIRGLKLSKSERYYGQQLHQNRLMLKSIDKAFPKELTKAFEYFQENLRTMTELMFFTGLASRPEDSAQIIVYNKVYAGRNIFSKTDLLSNIDSTENLKRVIPGVLYGGSTIQFPTGSLQMHKPNGKNLLQFRHSYKKVLASVTLDL